MKKVLMISLIFCLFLTGCAKENSEILDNGGNEQKFLTFNVKYEGVDVTPGKNFNYKDINNGQEPKISTIAGCALYGYDHVYTYDNVEITANIVEEGNYEMVYSVEFLNDTISTPEGIKIGSTVDNMIKAYGEGYDEFNGVYTYNGVGVYLTIQTKENIVKNINYTLVTN